MQGNRFKIEIHCDRKTNKTLTTEDTESTEKKPFIERYQPIYYSKTRFSEGLNLPFEDAKNHFKLKLCVCVVKTNLRRLPGQHMPAHSAIVLGTPHQNYQQDRTCLVPSMTL